MGEVERKGEPLLDEEALALLREQQRQIREEEAAVERDEERTTRPAKVWLFVSILLTLVVGIVSSVTSESHLAYGVLGFLPTLVACILFVLLLDGDYKDVLFWVTPLALSLLFFALAPILDVQRQLDVPVLTAVNLVLSYLILGLMFAFEYRKAPEATLQELEQFAPEHLDKYLHTIEEKCKALNFSIGRVYRASNGGNAAMRDKLKVSPEWYNEFHSIAKGEDKAAQKEAALAILAKIEERLTTYLKPEKELFTPQEVKSLKHLARDRDGKDRVLDVLIVNDSDPVEEYFLGALDFCRKVTDQLKKQKE